MSIYTAEQLDLSRLPAFTLTDVDYAAERAALVAGIQSRLRARGIPYDVSGVESDPFVTLAEEFAYRKTLDLGALNDAGRSLTLTYGTGAPLDQIAATYFADLGLRRLVLVPADPVTGTLPVLEGDERFKVRLSLAGQARSPGTLAGYELAALTAAPFLDDAVALNHASGLCAPGQIVVVLLGRDPDPNPLTAIPAQEEPAQVILARTAIRDRGTALGTDEVIVRAATRQPVDRGYMLGIRRGPDPNLVLTEARTQYGLYAKGVRRIGKLLAESREKAALAVGGIEYVHPLPGSGADVVPAIDAVVTVGTLTLTPEIAGG